MLEPGGDLDFAEEALRPQRLGQGGMQHLERHRARVREILGQVHRGHAPAAQLALQPVAVRQSGRQSRGDPLDDDPSVPNRTSRGGSTHGNLWTRDRSGSVTQRRETIEVYRLGRGYTGIRQSFGRIHS